VRSPRNRQTRGDNPLRLVDFGSVLVWTKLCASSRTASHRKQDTSNQFSTVENAHHPVVDQSIASQHFRRIDIQLSSVEICDSPTGFFN
jgi:hypothetical protein